MGIIDSLHVEGTAKTVGTIVVVLLAFYFFVVRKQTKGRIASKPAGGLPIIGHALKLEPAVMLDFFTDCWKAGGGNFEFSLVGKRVLVLTEWECIKDVLLRRPKVFTRGSGMVDWAIDLGITTGLFNIEGPVEWGRVRRLTAPSFAPHSIDSMFSVVSTESQTFLKDLTKAALQQKEDNRSIDGMKVCMQFTLRVIINLAFGSAVSQSQYLQSSDVLTDIESLFTWIHRRISIPLPTVVWKLYNDSLEKKAMNTSYMLDKAVSDIKQFYLEQCDSSNTSDKDAPIFLKTLLKSRSTGDSSGRKSDRDNLSDTDVAAQIKTFLIAGTETTAASISSAIQYLCDPAQERLVGAMYEETKNAFGDNDYPSTVEELQSLSLVTAFLKEALRLRGPAPCIFAEVSESEKSTNIKGGYQVNSPVSDS